MAPVDNEKVVEEILRYHEETKHHYERYARSPEHMDWQNQPNPFRFYEKTKVFKLPLMEEDPRAEYRDLYLRTNNPPQIFTVENIAGFLELSLGLSAWKAVGESRWSLRMNPSSGNLHPTEAHLILPPLSGLPGGVYHYNAFVHALEQRAGVSDDIWHRIAQHFGCRGFLIGLSSIFWREAWKYGERAFRYCNHDVGHALAAVSIAANLLGWKVTCLNGLSDNALDTILGFDKTRFESLEREHPDLLCFIHPAHQSKVPRALPQSIIAAFTKIGFAGTPNKLSKQQINWEIIYQTADLTRKPSTVEKTYAFSDPASQPGATSQLSGADIIRQRRSATDFDRRGSLGRNQLLTMLDKTLPRNGCAPFDVELMEASTHLFIFIHQVEDLAAGLYFFCRNDRDFDPLKRRTHSGFDWLPAEENFPLYLLQKGNYRQQATMVSCHQDIAGSSALSLGMIARFKDTLTAEPFRYRHLFWETGMIGQVLYLEAESHGVRGTGIGCFFDDAVHEMLGFKDNHYQSLYHFTIGRPVEDPRLTTYPAYHHLKKR
ncbi:MAG: SagB/ThcOx family dehydrogenase [bacterium]|nr:SagB/ThcOx family dehydrogenase [bacterium]